MALCVPGPSKRQKPDDASDEDDNEKVDDLDALIRHQNQPVIMSVYKDPESHEEMVCLVAMLPGGSKDVDFSLVGSGPSSSLARVTYSWPPIAHDIDAMFESLKLVDKMARYHPKVISLKTELEKTRPTIEAIPRGVMEFTLPIAVQTAIGSYSFRGGKKPDGSMVLIADLKSYQNAYTILQAEKKVEFIDF